jgi:tetratricopeptide (TPR) repeat protein
VNTNLEDISDWLTKMLVGVGLTQLYTVPSFVWKVAGKLDTDGFGWDKHGQLLAVVIFFYFAPGGFWLSYVGTRTILTRLFAQSESTDALKKAAAPTNLRFGIEEKELVGDGSDLADTDRSLLNTPRLSLKTPLQKAAWGAAQARAGNYTDAQSALEDAVSSEPNNSDFKQQLAKIYTILGNRTQADKLLNNVPATEVAVLNALYEPKPEGFEKAIQMGETLLQKDEFRKDPSLRVWMACAYAQQYGFRQSQQAPQQELASIKQKVLNEIDAAIALDPSTKQWLRSLWKPAPGETDNDLTVFDAGDPDLQKRLE